MAVAGCDLDPARPCPGALMPPGSQEARAGRLRTEARWGRRLAATAGRCAIALLLLRACMIWAAGEDWGAVVLRVWPGLMRSRVVAALGGLGRIEDCEDWWRAGGPAAGFEARMQHRVSRPVRRAAAAAGLPPPCRLPPAPCNRAQWAWRALRAPWSTRPEHRPSQLHALDAARPPAALRPRSSSLAPPATHPATALKQTSLQCLTIASAAAAVVRVMA